MKIIDKIKCYFNHHKRCFVLNLSENAALIKCSRCNKAWTIKLKGEFLGTLTPWTDSARNFYRKFYGYKGEI